MKRALLVLLLLAACDRVNTFGLSRYWRATCRFEDGTKWTGREAWSNIGDAIDNARVEGPEECVTYGADEYTHNGPTRPPSGCVDCEEE